MPWGLAAEIHENDAKMRAENVAAAEEVAVRAKLLC